MRLLKKTTSRHAILIFCNSVIAQIDVKKVIPAEWNVYKILQIPSKQLPDFGSKLKGEIKELKNYFIKTNDGEVQINKVVCSDKKEAEKIYNSISSFHKTKLASIIEHNEVFEIRSRNIKLVEKVNEILKNENPNNLKIKLTSIVVEDQKKALKFYTEVLGFVKKEDIPMGDEFRWITVVSKSGPASLELALEPNAMEVVKTFQKKLFEQGIPFTAFEVNNIKKEYERLKNLGVEFTMPPTEMMGSIVTVFKDTCGNLIQIYQVL